MAPNRKFEAASTVIPVARYRDTLSGVYLLTAGTSRPIRLARSISDHLLPVQPYYKRRRKCMAAKAIVGRSEGFLWAEPGVPVNHRGWPGEWPDLSRNRLLRPSIRRNIGTAHHASSRRRPHFFSFYWFGTTRSIVKWGRNRFPPTSGQETQEVEVQLHAVRTSVGRRYGNYSAKCGRVAQRLSGLQPSTVLTPAGWAASVLHR